MPGERETWYEIAWGDFGASGQETSDVVDTKKEAKAYLKKLSPGTPYRITKFTAQVIDFGVVRL